MLWILEAIVTPDVIGHIKAGLGPDQIGENTMRKLTISTIIVAALLTTFGMTSAVAVFEQSPFAAPAASHTYSIHAFDNGHFAHHGHTPLFVQ